MVKEIAASNVSLPKTLVIGLLMAALSAGATYYVGWSGVHAALAQHETQRQGDLALNEQAHGGLRADITSLQAADRRILEEQKDLAGQLTDVRIAIGPIRRASQ